MNVDSKLIFKSHAIFARDWKTFNPTSKFEATIIEFVAGWYSEKYRFPFQTSGSTGAPTTVYFTRKQILGSVDLTKNAFGLETGQVALLCLDASFVAGKMMVIRALECGMDLICAEPSKNPLLEVNLPEVVHFAAFVPYQLQAILNNPATAQKFKVFQMVLLGGASVSQSMENQLKEFKARCFETYGMTETLTHIAARQLNSESSSFNALGKVQFSQDKRDCLMVMAPHLGMEGEWITTNDIVELHDFHSFRYIGRVDNVVNSGGLKISCEKVENAITPLMHQFFSGMDFFVAGIPDTALGTRLVVLVEGLTDLENVPGVLLKIKPLLDKGWVPKEILGITTFERTLSGKISRKESLKKLVR